MKNDWFDVVLDGLHGLVYVAFVVLVIWFWAWKANYQIVCMFTGICPIEKISEERIKNE